MMRVASQTPFRSCFVDGSIRTFRFASSAIDTVRRNVDGHDDPCSQEGQKYYGMQQTRRQFVPCAAMPILILLCVLFATTLTAAPSKKLTVPDPSLGSVSGFVEDSATKETIVGATLAIKGTKLGAYSNKSGYFSISNIPPGERILVVTVIGYKRREIKLTVKEGESIKSRILMTSASVDIQEVEITARREDDRRQINISSVNIPMQQVSQMRIGGESDIFRALQMLPGVLTSSQISSGLYIRGGSPDQNLVLLDGMTVYNPTHLFGFIGAFNSEAIKDVELIKGGFPAEYGGRMSAVLNVTQKDGNRDKVEGMAGIGIISAKASVQGPVGNGSWFIGARSSFFDVIKPFIPEDPKSPLPDYNFYDVNAKISQDFGADDKVSLSCFITKDKLSLSQPGLDFSVGIGNLAGSARWSHIFGDNLFSVATFSASRYNNGFDGNNGGFIFGINNSIADYSAKFAFEWYVDEKLSVKTGYEGTIYNFTYDQNFSGQQSSGSVDTSNNAVQILNVWDNIHSAFGQMNYQFTDALSAQLGIRGNYWSKSAIATVDPRVALSYIVNDNVTVKAAWGIYHQYLRLASLPDFSFFDTWLPTDNTVPAGRAEHYILSVQTRPSETFDLNVDLYYKNLYNLNELNTTQTQSNNVGDVFYIGDGTAYGAEIFLQKRIGKFTGWAGYALGFVQAQFDSINRGAEFRPKYDRRHDLKFTAMYKLNDRWELGASFFFQTGQSYTGATSQFRGSLPGLENGRGMIVPSQRWGLRLPPSHQLNINANYNTTLFDLPFKIMIDIYNVYSRRDIWFRFYDTNKPTPEVTDVRLLPILPTVSCEVRF